MNEVRGVRDESMGRERKFGVGGWENNRKILHVENLWMCYTDRNMIFLHKG